MAQFRITQRRIAEIAKINKSVKAKKTRLKRLYGVDVEVNTVDLNSFESSKEYNAYIKEMEQFTDYKQHRYVELGSGDIVKRDEIVGLQKENKKRNKMNRKRVIDAIKTINKMNKTDLKISDFDKDLNLYEKHNLSTFYPVETSINKLTEGYQSSESIKRAKKRSKTLPTKSNFDKSKRVKWQNFLRSVVTEYGSIPAHVLLFNFVHEKGSDWFYNQYISGNVNPFEFMYKFDDYLARFSATMTNFGFHLQNGTGYNITDWEKPENTGKLTNKGKYNRFNKQMSKEWDHVYNKL